jgi:hypothetical protein
MEGKVTQDSCGDAFQATAEEQQEILSHAARLRDEAVKKKPFQSVKGLWADTPAGGKWVGGFKVESIPVDHSTLQPRSRSKSGRVLRSR